MAKKRDIEKIVKAALEAKAAKKAALDKMPKVRKVKIRNLPLKNINLKVRLIEKKAAKPAAKGKFNKNIAAQIAQAAQNAELEFANAEPVIKKTKRAKQKHKISQEYRKVFEGPFKDPYGNEYPLDIYERGPHKKVISVGGERHELAFPFVVYINYKDTLYVALSKHSFVSLDYKTYSSLPFNHFANYYACLRYETNTKNTESFINEFYSLSNPPYGVNGFFVQKWEKLSAKGFNATSFDWTFNKKFGPHSIRQIIYPSSFQKHPHQREAHYKKFFIQATPEQTAHARKELQKFKVLAPR